jgi:DNA polymerase III alpha subunit (gram-positive type)
MNTLKKDTIISFDIETTGLTPGINSMIALGAVAYRNGVEVASFYAALHEDPDTVRNAGTMEFWQKNKTEWKKIRSEARPIVEVMTEFADWVEALPSPRTLAANPSVFDAGFLFLYLNKFVDDDTVSRLFKRHRALDIRTYIAALFGVPYSEAERTLVPEAWSAGQTITHNALDDAREQGIMLMNLLRAGDGEEEIESGIGA